MYLSPVFCVSRALGLEGNSGAVAVVAHVLMGTHDTVKREVITLNIKSSLKLPERGRLVAYYAALLKQQPTGGAKVLDFVDQTASHWGPAALSADHQGTNENPEL